jgi:D-glycero-alpha-D-manno-heptose-7-phosphate kinase
LVNGDIRTFGELLDAHWRTKKNLSEQVSNDRIDQLYNIAMRNGALGGKIMGAGGGGFFTFYAENGKERLRNVMAKEGLKEVRFRFDFEGSKILLNL